MRVKKDKAYVVVSKGKERVMGAFPYTEEGKKQAYEYIKELLKKKDDQRKYKVKVL